MSVSSRTFLQEEVDHHSTHPVVSFIIPVLNDEQYIAKCLLSIRKLQNSDLPYEVIILDNGSTDHTHMIVEEMGFPFRVIKQIHVSGLRNRGAVVAQGEYLAFVDSDVELSSEWLNNGLAAFTDPQVVAVGCFPGVPKEATWVQRAWDIHQKGCNSEGHSVKVMWLPSMNLMVRRKAFLAIGGFNEQLATAEDVDLCYRLGAYGTILKAPGMRAIHWGEARDLSTFWRKEVWRGTGNFQGLQSHGFRYDELPSLMYPLYVLGFFIALVMGSAWDLFSNQLIVSLWCLGLLILPASLLALRTAWFAKSLILVPQLLVLYLVYGFARAYSAFKASFLKTFSGTAVPGDLHAD